MNRIIIECDNVSQMKDYLDRMNLDNCTTYSSDGMSYSEESTDMASKFNKHYSYVDLEGKPQTIRLYGNTEQETDKKFQEFILNGCKMEKESGMTLREYTEKVYIPTYFPTLAETTKANYNLYLKLYIFPVLGDMNLQDIQLEDIQKFNNWMAEAKSHGRQNDLNRKTIERVDGMLGRILRIATASGKIAKDPYCKDLLRNNGKQAGHHEALPDDEADRIKKAIPLLSNERQRLYMALLVFSSGGLRKEEILGLRWENVDLEKGVAYIKQVVTYGEGKRTIIKDEPKTRSSKRLVLLPKVLCDILAASKQERGFIIHGREPDQPISNATCKRMTGEAFEKLGMKGNYTSHDWRATQATALIENGMTSKAVADLLGHADGRMVETVYSPARQAGILKNKDLIEQMNKSYAG